MILCFSGNGNSRAVAKALGRELGEEVTQLRGSMLTGRVAPEAKAGDGDRIVWVMPVYSWGMPPAVADYIYNVADSAALSAARHYLVMTCGDDTGMTFRSWRRAMAARGWKGVNTYSVQMPNTYTLLPGFDVDKPEVTAEKLERMPGRVAAIASSIKGGEEGVDDVVKGALPRLKSSIYPLFRRYDIKPRKFRVGESCIGCGMCERTCPLDNIKLVDGRPTWGGDCTLCLGCYNCCPTHAIAYGRRTRGKGQFFNR